MDPHLIENFRSPIDVKDIIQEGWYPVLIGDSPEHGLTISAFKWSASTTHFPVYVYGYINKAFETREDAINRALSLDRIQSIIQSKDKR